jgi:sterol desaturase/sphingolipid hydroxylase (fatty acid hydroxylase superfamily)
MPPSVESTPSDAFKRKKTAKLKGLPYVNVKNKELESRKYQMKMPFLPLMTYESFLWVLAIGNTSIFLCILYPCFFAKEFGSNLSSIFTILGTCYILDFITKSILNIISSKNPVQIRLSSFFDDCVSIFFTLLLPTVHGNMLKHIALSSIRDTNIATFADIFRLYFWPDNEHNRKRVANVQNIVERYGNTIWIQMLKTPFFRGVIGYYCVEWFILPDTELTLLHVLTFPMKVMIYELVNDFIYYWMHRYFHENKWVYKHVHKLHHESKCPTGLSASTMTVGETALTFALTDWVTPFLLSPFLPMTTTEFGLFTCWICSIEVYGHSGHILETNSPSVWRMGLSGLLHTFNIQLEAKDHELHHWNNDFNYCKRTQIWDKVFGTFDYENRDKAAEVSLEPAKKKDS